MKTWIAALALAALPLAAAEKKTAPAPAPKPAAKAQAAPAPRLQIPAGAVESEPGTWRHTDAEGRKWIYRRTPFGVGRMEDKGDDRWTVQSPGTASRERQVRAVEEGGVVRFEMPGPWGAYKWERKKSELTEEEKGWLERSRSSSNRQE